MEVRSASALADAIEARIAAGELRVGDRLPTVRAAAAEHRLAANTVAAAYRRLRERGSVVGRGRQGTIVVGESLIVPSPVVETTPGLIDAASGNPDGRLLPNLEPALSAAAQQSSGRYGGALIAPTLDAAGRRTFERDGIDATCMSVASGAMDAVERLLAVRLKPGDRVGVEDPGYASVHHVVRALRLEAVPVSCDEFGVRPEALDAALGDDVAALIVTPRGGNPTSAAFDSDRASGLSSVLAEHPKTFVILDDHAGPIAGVPYLSLGSRRHWATVRSAAKAFGPDLRVALLAGDHDTIGRFDARLQVGPGWVSHLLQATVAELLNDPAVQSHVESAADVYGQRRRAVADRLAAGGVSSWARSGLSVWVPVADEAAVVVGLRDRGIAVRAGAAFRIRSAPAIRVSIAGLENDSLIDVADAFLDVLQPSRTTRLT